MDDITEGMAQVVALGGRPTGERHEYDEGVVVVMADPEEHAFCLTQLLIRAERGRQWRWPPGRVVVQRAQRWA